jgi:hypothetical protein
VLAKVPETIQKQFAIQNLGFRLFFSMLKTHSDIHFGVFAISNYVEVSSQH